MEHQPERQVADWLGMIRGLLEQAANQQRDVDSIYQMKEKEVWELTLRLERMKRDGTWARPIRKEHPSTGRAQGETEDAGKEGGRTDAIEIFPEEIWLKIMNELSDPADIWNCDNTCQLIEKILRPWKSLWMLEHALPYIYHQLTRNEILQCRAICRSWNKAIDNFLENHPSLRPYQETEGYRKRIDFVCPLKQKRLYLHNLFRFCNDPQRDNSAIMEEERFQRRGQNPFIGRFVNIKIGNFKLDENVRDQPEDSWWERFYQFLSTFGKEIWHLSVTFPKDPNQLVQNKLTTFVETLMFQSMPNLRKLTIHGNGCNYYNTQLSVDLLPEAPQLETLELISVDLPEMRFNYMFHPLVTKYAASQLKTLRLGGVNFVSVRGMRFENLKELILDVGGVSTSFIFEQLNAFSDYRMEKLSKVHLIFPLHHSEYLFEDLADFVNTLTAITQLSCLRIAGNIRALRFGTDNNLEARSRDKPNYNYEPTSLRILEVDLGWIPNIGGPPPFDFTFLAHYFPRLEVLSMFARKDYTSFDCSQLQYSYMTEVDILNRVDWEMKEAMNESRSVNENENVVQLHHYIFGESMYESRVWEVMTDLKLLTVQWDVFTREEYEARKLRQME